MNNRHGRHSCRFAKNSKKKKGNEPDEPPKPKRVGSCMLPMLLHRTGSKEPARALPLHRNFQAALASRKGTRKKHIT
jgi:hypothetical protein